MIEKCMLFLCLSAFDHTMQNVPVPVHLRKSSCIGPVVVVRWGTTGEHPVLNAILFLLFLFFFNFPFLYRLRFYVLFLVSLFHSFVPGSVACWVHTQYSRLLSTSYIFSFLSAIVYPLSSIVDRLSVIASYNAHCALKDVIVNRQ